MLKLNWGVWRLVRRFVGPRVKIHDHGRNNVVVLDRWTSYLLRGRIVLHGDNNRVEIGRACHSIAMNLELGSDSRLSIGERCWLDKIDVYLARKAELDIGAHSSLGARSRLQMHEPGRVKIGNDCLFSADVEVANSDMHSIVDAGTGMRINPAKDITIENGVWIGTKVMLLKGAHVGTGSVVGAGSIVTGAIPPGCLAVGSPARVVRTGVAWKDELI